MALPKNAMLAPVWGVPSLRGTPNSRRLLCCATKSRHALRSYWAKPNKLAPRQNLWVSTEEVRFASSRASDPRGLIAGGLPMFDPGHFGVSLFAKVDGCVKQLLV